MWSTYHEYGTNKKSESPTGIEPMIFHTVVGCSNHWTTKDLWWAGPCTRFMYDMRPAYRRISDVEIVMCVINKERWQILSSVKKREMMWSICHGHEMGQRKKKRLKFFLSFVAQWLEHSTGIQKVIGSIPIGYSEFFFVPCLWHVDHIISHCLCIWSKPISDRFRLSSELVPWPWK